MKNLPWVDNCHDLPHAGEIRLSFLTISHNDPFGLFFNKNIQCLKTDMTTTTIDFFGSVTFIEIYIIHFNFSLPFFFGKTVVILTTSLVLSISNFNSHFRFIFNIRSDGMNLKTLLQNVPCYGF